LQYRLGITEDSAKACVNPGAGSAEMIFVTVGANQKISYSNGDAAVLRRPQCQLRAGEFFPASPQIRRDLSWLARRFGDAKKGGAATVLPLRELRTLTAMQASMRLFEGFDRRRATTGSGRSARVAAAIQPRTEP